MAEGKDRTSISEFVVLDGSSLIGETMQAIAQKYHVTILHYHNPALTLDSKTPYNPLCKVRANFFIKVEGTLEDIAHLRSDSVNYAQTQARCTEPISAHLQIEIDDAILCR